jgi:hypothetical protein
MILTEEIKMAICEDYKDRSNRVADIAEKYGVLRADVVRIAVEMGAEPRLPKRFGQKRGITARTCHKCHKQIDVKGAKFCCFCGADIRTGKELAVEGLKKTLAFVLHLPINERDEAQQSILAAIKELENNE